VVTKKHNFQFIREIEPKRLDDRLDTRYYSQEYLQFMEELENSDYELIPLKEICIGKIHRGKTPKYVENGKIPVIKTANLKNGKIEWTNASFTSVEYYESNERSQANKNDILLASTGVGSLGKVDILNIDKKCVVDGHITIIRCNANIVKPEFLLNYLRKRYGQIQIEHIIRGTTGQIEVYAKDIELILIPKLPLKKQDEYIKVSNNFYKQKLKKLEKSRQYRLEADKCDELDEKYMGEFIIKSGDHSMSS